MRGPKPGDQSDHRRQYERCDHKPTRGNEQANRTTTETLRKNTQHKVYRFARRDPYGYPPDAARQSHQQRFHKK